jgi:hypothetical protein
MKGFTSGSTSASELPAPLDNAGVGPVLPIGASQKIEEYAPMKQPLPPLALAACLLVVKSTEGE